jgi:hypothetical protein
MSIQTIIDNATYIEINKRKVAASSVSRSGQLKTADRGVGVYGFVCGMHAGLTYSTNRGVLESLDTMDVINEANISLNNNTGMNYITAYQGDIEQAQLDNITMVGSNGANLYINCSGATGSGTLFKAGDFIQPKGNTSTYRYPYQVTSDVSFSVSANITVPVHRGVLPQTGTSITTGGLRVGNAVRFHVKSLNMPTYSIVPHDRIEFNNDFQLMEVITD